MNAIKVGRVYMLTALALGVLISASSKSQREGYINETIGPGLSYSLSYFKNGDVRDLCLTQRLKTQTPHIDTVYFVNGDRLDFTIDTSYFIDLFVYISYREDGSPRYISTHYGNDVPYTLLRLNGDGRFEDYTSYLINHVGTTTILELEEIKKPVGAWSAGKIIHEGNIDGRQILFDDSGKVKKSYLYDFGQLSR